MAGRTPPEAVAAFVEPLQQSISCVSPAVLQVAGGYRPAARPHALVLADGDPQPLRGDASLALRVAQQYRIVEDTEPRGPWKVQTAAYSYVVNRGEQELLAYQWNPAGDGRVTRPHLHVGAAVGELTGDFHRLHLPTGRIALEDVLRLLIEELGVQPLREEWSEVLDAAQSGYERWRTWSSSSGER
ncbi:MAG: hypothetical protein ACR2GL_02285 [Thermoleophilaceae bacterium]